MKYTWGHRGAPAEYPENTLMSFQRALELGLTGIELDVHLSNDRIPVVMHDETVDRTTNGAGHISDMTVAQLRALDAGMGQPVPTLGEVLDLAGDTLTVDIEVKANAAGAAVLQEVRQRPALRWLISSFDWDVLRYVRSQDAAAELWVLTHGATDEAIATYRELSASALAIWTEAVDQDIAEMLNNEGVRWWPWTVNDPVRARQCIDWGAIGICTDDPSKISSVLDGRDDRFTQ